jgi:hypothetical protein
MSDSRSVKVKIGMCISLTMIVFVGLLFFPAECLAGNYLAYVGPGSGITMLWALLAVLGGILFMILGLVLWPLRILLRTIKRNKSKNDNENTPNLNVENSNNILDDKRTISTPEHS